VKAKQAITRAVVHLGPEKTGTTALAKYMTRLALENKLPSSLIFPIGDEWFGRTDRIQKHRIDLERIVREFDRGSDISISDDQYMRNLIQAAQASSNEMTSVVLIAETALANIKPQSLTEVLLRYFDRVDYIIAARNQENGIRSLIAQRVRDKNRHEWNLDPISYLDSSSISFSSMDYTLMGQRWAPQNPKVSLSFIPYLESDKASFSFIDRFFRVLGIDETPRLKGIEGVRIHPTFSSEGMREISSIKKRLRTWGWVPWVKKRLLAQFETSSKIFHHSASKGGVDPSGELYGVWELTKGQSEWIREYYKASNTDFLANLTRDSFETDWELWGSNL
jgi:hypothetical protein